MYLGNIAGLIVVLTTVPLFAAILRIPFSIIAPIIIVDLRDRRLHGAQRAVRRCLMLVFGVIGYVFKKLGYPLAPLVLALVLGDMAESQLPAGDAALARQPVDLLVERAGRHDLTLAWPDLHGR